MNKKKGIIKQPLVPFHDSLPCYMYHVLYWEYQQINNMFPPSSKLKENPHNTF